MICLKSTLLKERMQAAQLAASQNAQIILLRERLEEADSRYRAVLEDLRLAVGLRPRTILVPTADALAKPPAKPEGPEWARNVTTVASFSKAAQLELDRQWAKQQQEEINEALSKRTN